MRQVDRDELIYMVAAALKRVPHRDWKEAADRRNDVQSRACALIAIRAVDALGRLEIMSDCPPANTPFSIPVARMLGDDPGPPVLIEDGQE